MTQYHRREFLGVAAMGAAALLAGPVSALAATRRKIPIGVQLYSVRNFIAKDVPGTLGGIKKIGYEGVEFAGGYYNYGDNPKGLRQLLDDTGLKAIGSHLPGGLAGVTGDQFDKTVEYNKVLGNDRLIVATMRASTPDDWARQADVFTGIAEKLKPLDMHIGYHNHVAEFTAVDGKVPEYIFFDKASPDVFLQLDIGHCAHGGGDPVAVLKKYPNRVYSVHAKDWVPATGGDIVGEGIVKWPEVLDACEAETGPKWYIVEEESNKFPMLDGIAKDYENLTKLLAS